MPKFIAVEKRSAVIPIEAKDRDEAREIALQVPLSWDDFDLDDVKVVSASAAWLAAENIRWRTREDAGF